MRFSLPSSCKKNTFKKTAIATLCNIVFVELATVAVAGDITSLSPDSLALNSDENTVEFKDELLDTFPSKPSITSLSLTYKGSIDADSPVINESYDYVARVPDSERWLVIFRDPHLGNLNGISSWSSWTDYSPKYPEKTELTIVADRTNLNPTLKNFDLRFSLFGAFFDGAQEAKDNLKKSALGKDDDRISALNTYFSDRKVELYLKKGNYDFYVSDIYASNNDFAGMVWNYSNDSVEAQKTLFESNRNTVVISLADNNLYFERIKGAKGATWRDLSTDNTRKPLTDASLNIVYVTSDENEPINFSTKIEDLKPNLIASERVYKEQVDPKDPNKKILTFADIDFYLKPSIMGGDALKAERNVVFLENLTTKNIDRKFGIVGGRAQDGTFEKNNTSGGADSNWNVVVLKNSNIGMVNDRAKTENLLDGTNVYGGVGYATAKGNRVVVSHSRVWGMFREELPF